MRRLLILIGLMVAVGPAWAQPAPAESVDEKAWEVLLKVLFPAIWTALAPLLTRGVTFGLLKVMTTVPQYLQVPISSIIGAVLAGLAGTVDAFPLSVESAATMGAAGGATGQMLFAAHPGKIPGEPGTVEAKT